MSGKLFNVRNLLCLIGINFASFVQFCLFEVLTRSDEPYLVLVKRVYVINVGEYAINVKQYAINVKQYAISVNKC